MLLMRIITLVKLSQKLKKEYKEISKIKDNSFNPNDTNKNKMASFKIPNIILKLIMISKSGVFLDSIYHLWILTMFYLRNIII
jgi:hypothetical protein